jgi:hypothetical protein
MICPTVALVLAAHTASSGLISPPAGARAAAVRPVLEAVVPRGQTYVLFDQRGNKIATYGAGTEPVILTRGSKGTPKKGTTKDDTVMDCVQIPCPVTFETTTVCWKCTKRPR